MEAGEEENAVGYVVVGGRVKRTTFKKKELTYDKTDSIKNIIKSIKMHDAKHDALDVHDTDDGDDIKILTEDQIKSLDEKNKR